MPTPTPHNKYDDFPSYSNYNGRMGDLSPYRDTLSDILSGILKAYNQMLQPSYPIIPPNDEDLISGRLYEDFLDNDDFRLQNNLNDYTFELEPAAIDEHYKQVGYKDFKVRVNNRRIYFESTKSAYVIECKRLVEKINKDNTNSLNEKYVMNGIKRFVDEIYTEKNLHKYSAMLGYIISPTNIHDNVSKINSVLGKTTNLNTKQELKPYSIDNSFEYAYHSKHVSVYGNNIDIYHLMLDFSSKIKAES